MLRDEFESTCRDVCPHCNAGIPTRQREDTREYVHDRAVGKSGFAHSVCMTTHFRNKYKDQLSGQ